MTQRESKLSRAIMGALRSRGIFCFKVHGGPTMMAGLPDIIACVPVRVFTFDDYETGHIMEDEQSVFGLFVGLETKNPDGGDPSPIQQHVHDEIRATSGRVYVVRSVQDAIDAIHDAGWTEPPGGMG